MRLSAITALALLASIVPELALADDASMFRAGSEHLGVYASAAPKLTTVRWRFKTGGRIMSSPTVAGGSAYVGSVDGNLYAVSTADGAMRWKFKTKSPVNSTPAVAGDVVFFSSVDGFVYAVGASDGRLRWRFATKGERRFEAPGIHGLIPKNELMPDPFDTFLSSPAVVGRTVYIGSGDHHVYALDAATGALRWSFTTGNVVHASPAVANGTVYIGSWDRYFYALDAATGRMRWKFETGDDRTIYNQVGIAGSAAVAGGTVYFGCRDSHFYALDVATGHLRWKQDHHGSWVIASPAVYNGSVYFTTSDEKRFYAVDAQTGATKFTVPYDTFAYSSPSIAGGVAYYGSFDGHLYGIDVRTGSVVAQFVTDAAAAKGKLDLNAMYTDNTLDGIIVGLSRIYAYGSIAGSPAIADGTLYIGSTEGILYALG